MITTEPWHIDFTAHQALQQSPQKASTYTLLEGGPSDYQKVTILYQKSPIAGYHIGRIEIIHNPALTRQFEGKVMVLNERAGSPAFAPKWDTEQDKPLRTRIDQALKTVTIQHPATYHNVQLFPAFHGTKAPLLDSIFRTGFANLATTDSGFFGKGIYNTSHAEYAHRVYSDGTLLYNWVAFYSAYPVTLPDMPKLQGSSNHSNYDAHYTLVSPKNPQNPNEVIYHPITSLQHPTYDEHVVFDSSHVLPRYLVTLAPDGPNLTALVPTATGLTLMMSLGAYFPEAPLAIHPLLQTQITNITPHLTTPLNPAQLTLFTLLERTKGEADPTIKTTLANRITKLLDTGRPLPIPTPQGAMAKVIAAPALPPQAFGKALWATPQAVLPPPPTAAPALPPPSLWQSPLGHSTGSAPSPSYRRPCSSPPSLWQSPLGHPLW